MDTDNQKPVPIRKARMVSVVSPAFNEGGNLQHLCERLVDVLEAESIKFEIIIVNDGSTDESLEVLRKLHREDERIHYLNLTRNFGTQGALLAGFEHSRGDLVVSIDADLQNPPELIPNMMRAWESGYDVVNATKKENMSVFFVRKLIDRFFYAVFSKLSGITLFGHSDFKLLDRKVVNILCGLPERNKFLRGLTAWVGFRQTSVEYNVHPRYSGTTRQRFLRLAKLAVDAIFSFSIIPIRLFTIVGMVVSIGSILYGLHFAVLKVYSNLSGAQFNFPPGWVTIVAVMLFLGGVQLMGIGLLGEYLGRVYDEVKGRPSYLIKEGTIDLTSHKAQDAEEVPVRDAVAGSGREEETTWP